MARTNPTEPPLTNALTSGQTQKMYMGNIDLGDAGASSKAYVDENIRYYFENGKTKFAVVTGLDKKGNHVYTKTDFRGLESTVNNIEDENLRMAALGNLSGMPLNYSSSGASINLSPSAKRKLHKEGYYNLEDIGTDEYFGAFMNSIDPKEAANLTERKIKTIKRKGKSETQLPIGRGTEPCGPDGCDWNKFSYGGNTNNMKDIYMFGGAAHGLAKAFGANDSIANAAGMIGGGVGMFINPVSGGMDVAKYGAKEFIGNDETNEQVQQAFNIAGQFAPMLGNPTTSFAFGGNTNPEMVKFGGDTHEQGGTMFAPGKEAEKNEMMYKDFIFTDRLGPKGKKGKSYAQMAEAIRKKHSMRGEEAANDEMAKEAMEKELQMLIEQHESDPKILKMREKQQNEMFAYGGMKYQAGGPFESVLNFDPNEGNTGRYYDLESRSFIDPNMQNIMGAVDAGVISSGTYRGNEVLAQNNAANAAANNSKQSAGEIIDQGTGNPYVNQADTIKMRGLEKPNMPGIQGGNLPVNLTPQMLYPGTNIDYGTSVSGRPNENFFQPQPTPTSQPVQQTANQPIDYNQGNNFPQSPMTRSGNVDGLLSALESMDANPQAPSKEQNVNSQVPDPRFSPYAAGALMSSIGPMAQGIGTLIGGPDETNFDRINPAYVNYDPARNQAKRSAGFASASAKRNLSAAGQTRGQLLANQVAADTAIGRGMSDNLSNIEMSENTANTQIANTTQAQNAQIQMQEQIANEQNRAAYRDALYGSATDLGNIGAGAMRDYRMDKAQALQDQRTLNFLGAMFPRYTTDYMANLIYQPVE